MVTENQALVTEVSRVLPPGDYPIFEMPMDHPVFCGLSTVTEVPKILSIQHWRRRGGTTSERGYLSADVHFRAVADEDGCLMIVMSHNTDIADGWERGAEDVEFFHRFSIDAYAVGFDVLNLHDVTLIRLLAVPTSQQSAFSK